MIPKNPMTRGGRRPGKYRKMGQYTFFCTAVPEISKKFLIAALKSPHSFFLLRFAPEENGIKRSKRLLARLLLIFIGQLPNNWIQHLESDGMGRGQLLIFWF